MINKKVTLVITSCGRFDLLKKTLESFFKFNTYPIEECIIVEDSGNIDNLDFLKSYIPVKTKFIINKINLGQMKSIDLAYAEVTTPFIFHCEDDWEFYKHEFIENSFKILDVDTKVITVWLRSHSDTNGCPLEDTVMIADDITYKYIGSKKKWHGFTFNPGLRRTADCLKFYPITELTPVAKKRNGMIIAHEIDLSIYYFNAGYKAAIINDPLGSVRHIGWSDHILSPWEK